MTSEVKSPLCFTGFGNPSDEVVMNVFVHTSLFLHAIEVNEKQLKRMCLNYLWPLLASIYLSLNAFGLVVLGSNSINQVVYGATIGVTSAVIFNYFVKPAFIYLPSHLLPLNQIHQGEDVLNQDRYMLRCKHLIFVALFTFVLPITIAVIVLISFGDEIDGDFKE